MERFGAGDRNAKPSNLPISNLQTLKPYAPICLIPWIEWFVKPLNSPQKIIKNLKNLVKLWRFRNKVLEKF